jgi:outer membrane protein OmpU
MGIMYDGEDVALTSRARVTFTLSGETDGGLAFGGSFRADNASGAAEGAAGSVFISSGSSKLEFGDVDGAALAATGDLYAVGLTGLGDRHEMQYVSRLVNGVDATTNLILGADGLGVLPDTVGPVEIESVETGLNAFPRALYTYSIDNFSVFASVAYSTTDEITLNGTTSAGGIGTSPRTGSVAVDASLLEASIGASYTFEGFMVAAGYENARLKVDGDSLTLGHATLAAGYSTETLGVKAFVGKAMSDLEDIVPEDLQYGLGVTATFDATKVSAFARRDFFDLYHYGVGASYDLGGGASIMGGVAKTEGSDAVADFGLSFTF